jgi:hypothetical protein
MLKLAAEQGLAVYAVCALVALAVACLARNAREIWFVVAVACAVATALGAIKRRRTSLVVEIGGVDRLTFFPARRR